MTGVKTKRKSRREFTEVFKLEVLRDYYSSGLPLMEISRKWGVLHSTLIQWKKRWPVESKSLSLPVSVIFGGKKEPKPMSEEELKQRIKALESALEIEKMRSRAFEKMIEIAEAEEGISILKKGGAKQ